MASDTHVVIDLELAFPSPLTSTTWSGSRTRRRTTGGRRESADQGHGRPRGRDAAWARRGDRRAARDIDVAVAGFSIKAISNGMGGGIAFDAVFSTVVMVLAKCVASGEANGLLPEEDERNAMILRGLGLHVDIFRAQLRKSAQ
ncbi:MAG: hypothetical protein HZY79_15680 [Rhodoblastus sp.]|nr:MAG: hypothetical protein HZY79_15680 [Rhodoblastus sp.]